MRPEFLVRQADIIPEEAFDKTISVVGAGAIGSQVVLCLAKMGFENISVYDFDHIDEENISNQWYGPGDIGENKVEALEAHVMGMTGVALQTEVKEISPNDAPFKTDIIVAAVDSMKVRKMLWEMHKDSFLVKYFIDPRMSAEEGAIYCVDMANDKAKERYEKTLYTDEEAMTERCTAKATMYCSMLLAGQTCKTIKDLVVKDSFAHTAHWNVKENAVIFYK
jgi:molybdopterin/thiamine biosynthesis adenylyltransferase